MRVADRYSRNTTDKIDIPVSCMVVEVLEVALDYEKGLLVVMEIKVRHVRGSIFDHLLVRRACVGRWLVVHCGEWSYLASVVGKCKT